MRPIFAVPVLAALAACGCQGKAVEVHWTAHDAGAILVEFPCVPRLRAGTAHVSCVRPDGSEYALYRVSRGVAPEVALAEAREYVRAIPNGELLDERAFPIRWREVRRSTRIEMQMWYLDGVELTLAVSYATPSAPREMAEFFSRAMRKTAERED